MKKQIIASLAMAAASLAVSAQDYNVIVKTTDGETHTFPSTNLEKIRFVEAPDYIDLNSAVSGKYAVTNDLGEFSVMLSDSDIDTNGQPVEVGGYTLVLTFTTEKMTDVSNPMLPAGYYRASSGPAVKTWNISKSGLIVRTDVGDNGVSSLPLINGTIDVAVSNSDTYTIRAEVNPMGATEEIGFRYQGAIEFIPDYTAMGGFETDQQFTATGAQGRFYSNWTYPFACDMTMAFYNGNFNASGAQTEGFWINMPINMPKVENPMDPNQKVADGVYTVEPRTDVAFHTYFPFTMEKGHSVELFGETYPVGTYVMYTAPNGQSTHAYITDGTMTVSGDGTKFDIDLITENGIHIRSSYNGQPLIQNFCDNDEKQIDPVDTLTEDHELSFNSSDVAIIYPLGDYIRAGVGEYQILVGDPNYQKGDFVQLELCSGLNGLEDGTYTINDDIHPFGGIRGRIDSGGGMTYSTYGDFSSTTPDGIQETIASIDGGTVTVETTGATIKMTFNLITLNGHKLTGTFEGPVMTYQAPAPPHRLKMR